MSTFLRNYATPLCLAIFAAAGVTGVMLFLGVHTHSLSEIHEWFGVAFVIVAVLHLFRNAKGFGFLMGQTRSLIVIGVLGVATALLIGSAMIPGLGSQGGHGGHGGPPQFQIAERLSYAPISQLAPALGMSSTQAIAHLRKGGVTVSGPGQNLADIARKQNVDTRMLFALVLADQPDGDDD
jgi:hypothetical protein